MRNWIQRRWKGALAVSAVAVACVLAGNSSAQAGGVSVSVGYGAPYVYGGSYGFSYYGGGPIGSSVYYGNLARSPYYGAYYYGAPRVHVHRHYVPRPVHRVHVHRRGRYW